MFETLFRGRRNDRRSREIACIAEYEYRAADVLERNAHEFFRSGAGCEQTIRLNRLCYEKIRIRPRCLARVGNRSLSVNALGCNFKMPIGIGPVALAKLAHCDGEKALARAARSMGGRACSVQGHNSDSRFTCDWVEKVGVEKSNSVTL
nr:hydroxyacid oxidase 1-like [Aedes albopictus]